MKIKAILLAAGLVGLCSQAALAADGRVNFLGKVMETTCTTPGTINLDMGTIALHDLTDVGDRTRPRDLNIILSNCNLGTVQTATVGFVGLADSTDNHLLVNQKFTGAAEGIAIDLQDVTGKQVVNATSNPYTLVDGATSNYLLFSATGVRTAPKDDKTKWVAGEISTFADFTITYK